MTPLEQLIDDHRAAFLQQQWYDLAAFETKAKATIKAMGECARRGLGQRFRYITQRLKGQANER